jgi:hypothetical protein
MGKQSHLHVFSSSPLRRTGSAGGLPGTPMLRQWIVVLLVIGACIVGASSCFGAAAPVARIAAGGEVMLVSKVSAGSAGWCMAVVTERSSGCSKAVVGAPIVGESWSSGSPPLVTEGGALTTCQVASVSVDGSPPVATRAEPATVDGLCLRGVVVEIPSNELRHEPSFTALNARGERIAVPTKPGLPLALRLSTRRDWRAPECPPHSPCELSVHHMSGLVARWGAVATRVRSYPGLVGRAFQSCVDAEYFNSEEQPIHAAVLLDAAHPGVTPGPLPGMKPLVGHPGIFQAPGGSGAMTARRIRGAWLVVEGGGSTLQERLVGLEHLRATVHL